MYVQLLLQSPPPTVLIDMFVIFAGLGMYICLDF